MNKNKFSSGGLFLSKRGGSSERLIKRNVNTSTMSRPLEKIEKTSATKKRLKNEEDIVGLQQLKHDNS